MSRTPVANWSGRNRLMPPAMSRTICIGSRYWRGRPSRSAPWRLANLFGPYVCVRVATSAADSPASCSTFWAAKRFVDAHGVPDRRFARCHRVSLGHVAHLCPLLVGHPSDGDRHDSHTQDREDHQ